MALLKPIKQSNGIILTYHRIKDIRNVINDKTYIEIASYVDEEEREREKKQPKYSPRRDEVYIIYSNEEVKYNDTLTIREAYEYLKTTDKYKGAIDV